VSEGLWELQRRQIKELQSMKEQAILICTEAAQLFRDVQINDSSTVAGAVCGLLERQAVEELERLLQGVPHLIEPVQVGFFNVPALYYPRGTRGTQAFGRINFPSAHQAVLGLGNALGDCLRELLSLVPRATEGKDSAEVLYVTYLPVASDTAEDSHLLVKHAWPMLRGELAGVAHFDVDALMDAVGRESRTAMENCGRLAPGGAEAVHESTGKPPATPAVDAEAVGRLLALCGDGTALQILRIARDQAKAAEERMRAVVELDRRFDGFNSVQWGELLGISAAAVRQTEFWVSRKQRREER
jgi:hypothetical protein